MSRQTDLEELVFHLTWVEYLFEGGLTQEEPDPDCPRPRDTGEG